MFLEKYCHEKSLAVIAPSSLRRLFLSEKVKSFPSLDLKFFSKSDLLKGLTFESDLLTVEEAKNFLETSYAIAQEFVSLLPVVSLAEQGIPERFSSLLEHLDGKRLLYRHPSFAKLLQGKKVVVFAYSKLDRELALMFKKAGVVPFYEEMPLNPAETPVHAYFDEKRETVAAFERIRHDIETGIVDGPSSVNLLAGPGYEKEIRRLLERYGLPVNGLDDATLSSFPSYKKFYASLEGGMAVEEAFAALDSSERVYSERKALAALLSEISPLSSADRGEYLKLLQYGADRKRVAPHPYKDGINLVSLDEATPYLEHLYVIGFNAPAFPLASKDDGLLSTAEKEAMGINTALVNNAMAASLVRTLLRSGQDRYISLVDKNGLGEDDKPPFRPYVMEQEPIREERVLPLDQSGSPCSYSKAETEFLSARAKDNLRLYREQSEEQAYYSDAELNYCGYDNSFTGASFPVPKPLELSYSSLDEYLNCPFRFYLNKFLLTNNHEYSFSSAFGTLFHFAVQIEQGGTIDWSAVAARADELFGSRLLDRSIALEKAKYAEILVKRHDEFIAKSEFGKSVQREAPVLHRLSDDLLIKGRIDEACFSSDRVIIVDFKTGSASFSYNEALKKRNLQLPTYLLMARELFDGYQPVGAFIVSVKGFGLGCDDPFKLDGIFLDDEDTMIALDPALQPSSVSHYVEGLKRKKDGDYGLSSKRIGEAELKKLADTALEAFKEVGRDVYDREFPIAPKRVKGRTPCKLCGLRDVCFLKDEQIVEDENDDSDDSEGGNDK